LWTCVCASACDRVVIVVVTRLCARVCATACVSVCARAVRFLHSARPTAATRAMCCTCELVCSNYDWWTRRNRLPSWRPVSGGLYTFRLRLKVSSIGSTPMDLFRAAASSADRRESQMGRVLRDCVCSTCAQPTDGFACIGSLRWCLGSCGWAL